MRRDVDHRGVILLSVLWIVLILSVTSLSLATAARTQMFATGNNLVVLQLWPPAAGNLKRS